MGFRFHNLNPIYRAYITRVSSPRTHKYSHPYPVTQNLISHLRDPPLILSQNLIYNIPIRWHLGHSHHDDDDGHHHHISGQEGEKIFKLGLVSDIALSTGKALTGYLSGSTAIIADAAHSVSDVVLSVSIVIIFGPFFLLALYCSVL